MSVKGPSPQKGPCGMVYAKGRAPGMTKISSSREKKDDMLSFLTYGYPIIHLHFLFFYHFSGGPLYEILPKGVLHRELHRRLPALPSLHPPHGAHTAHVHREDIRRVRRTKKVNVLCTTASDSNRSVSAIFLLDGRLTCHLGGREQFSRRDLTFSQKNTRSVFPPVLFRQQTLKNTRKKVRKRAREIH